MFSEKVIVYYADENEKGPNCGVVDEGNENCFNGDFGKLNEWVNKIYERGNEKEIMNKLNHNPCVREWLWDIGILNDINNTDTIIQTRLTKRVYSSNCPKNCPTGKCTMLKRDYLVKDPTTGVETWVDGNWIIRCN